MVAAAIWVGLLALLNVRERWREIGILRAVGRGSGEISRLFLGRALLVGALGALLGFVVGTGLALRFGPDVFKVTGGKIEPLYVLLVWSLVAAPALAACSALVPALLAVTQDPAVALRDE
jgi:putative ABC transport system permease protein